MKAHRFTLRGLSVNLAFSALLPTSAFAHVGLNGPTGGETLVAGSTFRIAWEVLIEHDTLNWDLWYSTVSDTGPWTEIATDLPLGDPTEGALHFYNWLIPDAPDSSVWLQVRQDNDQQTDWYDESEAFSILAAGDFNGSGQVDGADLQIWEAALGNSSGVVHGDGDANLDGLVDARDYLIWQRQTEEGSQTSTVQSIPEPTTMLLFLLGCMSVAHRGRC